MRWIISLYLVILLIIGIILGFRISNEALEITNPLIKLGMFCVLFGVLGGITHCIRSIYLHSSLKKDWDNSWNIWYFLRPIVSGIIGLMSMIVIKAGLLAFNADTNIEDRLLAYLAIAFLAGYNVKNFLSKLEDISKSAIGIEKKNFDD